MGSKSNSGRRILVKKRKTLTNSELRLELANTRKELIASEDVARQQKNYIGKLVASITKLEEEVVTLKKEINRQTRRIKTRDKTIVSFRGIIRKDLRRIYSLEADTVNFLDYQKELREDKVALEEKFDKVESVRSATQDKLTGSEDRVKLLEVWVEEYRSKYCYQKTQVEKLQGLICYQVSLSLEREKGTARLEELEKEVSNA